VSRQFVEMNRLTIEGLLNTFPKLIESGKQHTFVETESIRYVYQPLDDLYILLITDKRSNILEDLETLRLFGKLVPEYCGQVDELSVENNSFELIFVLDEIISLGHKESVTLLQVKQNCEMESHEERLHNLIIENKINETRDIMKKKAADIEKAKMEQKRLASSNTSSMLSGFGGGGSPMSSSNIPGLGSTFGAPAEIDVPARGGSGADVPNPTRPQSGARAPSKGMRLGGKPKGVVL